MNRNAPHTILLVNHPRVRLALPRLSRVLGPGVYHFQGDLRPLFKSLNQLKLIQRGAIEIFLESGDTAAFLARRIEALNAEVRGLYDDGKTPDDATLKNLNARLSFYHTLAAREGINVRSPVVATLESEVEEVEIVADTDISTAEPVVKPDPMDLPGLTVDEINHLAAQLISMPHSARNEAVLEIKAKFNDDVYLAVVHRFNALFNASQTVAAEETSNADVEDAAPAEAEPESDDADEADVSAPEAVEEVEVAELEAEVEDPAPEPVDEAGPEAEVEESESEDVGVTGPGAEPASVLNGIGAKTQAKLEALGLGTIGAIATATPAQLAQVDTISEDEAIAHIAEAKARLGE